MNFVTILFYIFSFVLISSALVVVSTRNTIHSVMFLILAFFNAAALFVILGAEFVAMLLVIVYVGAIAVLFLFVVMMLNVDTRQIVGKATKHVPVLLCVSIVLFLEIFLLLKVSTIGDFKRAIALPIDAQIHNTQAIGNVLYTNFILPFQISGAILFVAMIGAILLTLRESDRYIRKQKIADQVLRDSKTSIKLVKVESGKGINI